MNDEITPVLTERSRLLTLVFTDLVNSVGLKTKLGDGEAGRIISLHHEGLRKVSQCCGGREILVAGDGSFLTFETPSQAVEFALQLQQYHKDHPTLPAVRVGIHMGEVTERNSGEPGKAAVVEGLAVDIASRIQSLATARQILMSYPVFDNARQRLDTEALQAPVEWRAHGRYTFQGTDTSLEIFEAGLKGLAPFLPPSGSTKAHRDVRGDEESTLGWRPAQGLELPGRPNWMLLEKLGEGGFGDVWMVEHRKTRERHVIKFCYSTDHLRALKREVTLFRLLKETLGDRPDIARVMDYQFDTPPYYLEMEFAGRHNLTSWLQEHGGVDNIPLDMRVELVAQVAEAIAAAHSVGVLHKDIKPSNIMVTDSGTSRPRIRMIDFGIGTISDRQLLDEKGITATGLTEVDSGSYGASLTGTRLYMAPELVEGKPATTKSDIYSLGVVLYQLVSGRLGQSLSFGWERDIADELLREDIKACTDGLPENRIVSAEELARRLRNLPKRRQQREKLKLDIARLETSRKRRRLYYAAATLIAVLIIFVAQYAFLQKQKAETAFNLQQRAEAARKDALKQTEYTRRALAEAEHARYFGAVALAEASLREARFDKLQEVLFNEAPAEYRGREWGWLLAQSMPEDFAIKRFDAFDTKELPSRGQFIAGRRDTAGKGILTLFDIHTGRALKDIPTNDRLVWNLAISPDDRLAATASSDRVVTVVDVESWTVLAKLNDHTAIIRDVEFSRDGTTLATCSRDHTIHLYNTSDFSTTGVIQAQEDNMTEISISPDSRYIVSASLEGHVRVFDLATQQQVAMLSGHTDRVLSVDFLRSGTGIATACKDGKTRIFPWPPEDATGVVEPLVTITARSGYPSQVASSMHGHSIYVGNDNGLIIKYNTKTGLEESQVQVDQPLWKITPCQDDAHVLTTARWSVRLLDMERLESPQQVRALESVEKVPGGATVMDVATVINTRDQTWSADQTWKTTTGLSVVSMKRGTFLLRDAYHVYSPDYSSCVTIDQDSLKPSVRIVATGEEVLRLPENLHISTANYSPDGKRLALGTSTSGTIVYSTQTWQPDYTITTKFPPSNVYFTADNKTLLIAYFFGDFAAYDASNGAFLRKLTTSTRSNVMQVDVSEDGKLVAAGLDVDRAIVINLETGDQLSTMSGHLRYVHGVKFTPDGQRLATLSRDGTVKFWDVATGRELVTLFNFADGIVPLAVHFSTNGRYVYTVTSDHRIYTTEIFPWGPTAYGDSNAPLIDRVELWKRRNRMSSYITMDDVAPDLNNGRMVGPPGLEPGTSRL